MKKSIFTLAIIASMAIMLSNCKKEETKSNTTTTTSSNSDFVKFGTAANIALARTLCEFENQEYGISGTQNNDTVNTGAAIGIYFTGVPAAGNYTVKNDNDTADLKSNECIVLATQTGGVNDLVGATSGQVVVTSSGGKLRATATNLPGLTFTGQAVTISASIGCK